jgi:hypothetical protein
MKPPPDDYLERLNDAEIAGDITPEDRAKREEAYHKWHASIPGQIEAMTGKEEDWRAKQEEFALEGQQRQLGELDARKEIRDRQAEFAQAQYEDQVAYQADAEKRRAELNAEYEQSIQDVKQAKIDPYKDRMPIVEAVALAFGQLGAALGGGPNSAMQIVNAGIERNIAAQEKNLETAKTVAQMKRTQLGELVSEGMDRARAKQVLSDSYHSMAEDELSRRAEQGLSADKQAGVEQLKQQFEVDRTRREDERNLQHQMASEMHAQEQALRRRAAIGAMAALKKKEAEWGKPRWATKNADQMRKRYVPGLGFAVSEKSADELNTEMADHKTYLSMIDRVLEVGAKPWSSLSPKEQGESKAIRTNLLLIAKNKFKTGALDKGSVEVLDDMLGDPTKVFSGQARAKLEQSKRNAEAGLRNRMKQQSITPGIVGQTVNEKTGQIEEGYQIHMQAPETQEPVEYTPIQ